MTLTHPVAYRASRARHGSPAASPGSPDPQAAITRIEVLHTRDVSARRQAWRALTERCLEPNVFLDPDFAIEAALELPGRKPAFALVWATGPRGDEDLVAVCPLASSRDPLLRPLPVWHHDLSALGSPLLDAARATVGLAGLFDGIARALPRVRSLLFHALPREGPTATLLREFAAARALPLVELAAWERAVLRGGARHGRAGLAALSGKAAKEIRRQGRRLAESGVLGYASARSDADLAPATDRFLALESAGWKGAAGTALLRRPAEAAFARTLTRLLGARGLCRIDSLTLDGAPIAMAVVLRAGRTDFFWKTAYAEEHARLSPGVQLVVALTEAQARETAVDVTDSCAIPDHPMIDRLWRDRLALQDVVIGTMTGRDAAFHRAVARERAFRALRSLAKRLVGGRKRGRPGPHANPAISASSATCTTKFTDAGPSDRSVR